MSAAAGGNGGAGPSGRLDWLLSDFTRSVPGVRHALVVSGDGLLLAASERIDTGFADQLAAGTSGLASLARGVANSLGAGPVEQTIVEMAGGYLFITSISPHSALAVLAEPTCDMGMVGYEITMLASRVGHALSPATRAGSGGAGAATGTGMAP